MKIGILGGGQLARLLALAGYPLGLSFLIYDPDPGCCAAELAPGMAGNFTQGSQLSAFADQVDLITYETENIPLEPLKQIAEAKPLFPCLNALEISQDRLLEKTFLNRLKIPTTHFMAVSGLEDLQKAAERLGYPFLLKTCQQGYDGKGQWKIRDASELNQVTPDWFKQTLIAEAWVSYTREFSCIGVRSVSGEIQFYDLCENVHEAGILVSTRNCKADPFFEEASCIVQTLMTHWNYVGVLAVEFFQVGSSLLVNEIAPRVHNSGHWTWGGAFCSQFENHLRAGLDLSLGNTQSRGPVLMKNILGEIPDIRTLLSNKNLSLSLYGKAPKPGRKLGHTVEFL